ncbi:hypothetical protein, partial [Streptosporangium sp. NPDC003464]
MKRLRNLVLAVTAVVLAFAFVPTSAWAATTKIHRNDQFGALYSGKVRATLIGNVSISTSLATATCNVGVIDGTVQSDGTIADLGALLSEAGVERADAVVSTLPWSLFPGER